MPKLDPFQISSRLHDKLEDLLAGKEVAARDLKVLLSDERLAAMEQAWAEQKALRKKKRARTKEEEAALGWKSKRQIQIDAVEAPDGRSNCSTYGHPKCSTRDGLDWMLVMGWQDVNFTPWKPKGEGVERLESTFTNDPVDAVWA